MIKVGDKVKWAWDGTPNGTQMARTDEVGEIIGVRAESAGLVRGDPYPYKIKFPSGRILLAKANEITVPDPLELLAAVT